MQHLTATIHELDAFTAADIVGQTKVTPSINFIMVQIETLRVRSLDFTFQRQPTAGSVQYIARIRRLESIKLLREPEVSLTLQTGTSGAKPQLGAVRRLQDVRGRSRLRFLAGGWRPGTGLLPALMKLASRERSSLKAAACWSPSFAWWWQA